MKRILIIALIIVLVGAVVTWALISLSSKPSIQAQRLYEKSLKLIEADNLEEARVNLEKIVTDYADSKVVDEAILNLALFKVGEEKLLEAKNLLNMALTLYPTADSMNDIQKVLWDVNIKILFSPIIVEDSLTYVVKEGDTLYEIAKNLNTTVDLIRKSNNMETSIIRPGKKLKISTAHFSVVVDKSKNILTLKSGEEVLKVYLVSTGANNSTPVGTFKIENKLRDPVWYKAGAIVAAESDENILGSRWLGLSAEGYGIHGTIEPETIGQQITQGCVRMRNSDVEELYAILPVGTEVVIVD